MATKKVSLSALAVSGYSWPTSLMRAHTTDGAVYVAQRINRRWIVWKLADSELATEPEYLARDLSLAQARRMMCQIVENDWRNMCCDDLELVDDIQ